MWRKTGGRRKERGSGTGKRTEGREIEGVKEETEEKTKSKGEECNRIREKNKMKPQK